MTIEGTKLDGLESTRRRVDDACVSDLMLDRLLDGELAAEEAAAVDRHTAGCDACSARRGELEAALASFADERWIEGLARATVKQVEVAARPTPAPAPRNRWFGGLVALAAAAVLAVAVWPAVAPVEDPGTRTKGMTPSAAPPVALQVYAKRADGGAVERLLPGDTASADDAIRFEIGSGVDGAAWVGVVGIDAAGAVTPYQPPTGTLVQVQGAEPVLLEGSTILDATLGAERLVAVSCDAPYPMTALVSAGQAALATASGDPAQVPALTLPEGCRQTSLVFHKVSR